MILRPSHLDDSFQTYWLLACLPPSLSHLCLLLCGLFFSGIYPHTFRSACLPRYLEAEWIFGGVKYQYGGNQEGKWCFSLVEIIFTVRESPMGNFFQSSREACHVAGPHSRQILVCLQKIMWSNSEQGSHHSVSCSSPGCVVDPFLPWV